MTKDKLNPKDFVSKSKLPITLVPPSAILYLAEALKNGADKYGPYNWRQTKVKASIYIDATMRHLLAYLDGEETAEDSRVSHLAHAMASLAVLIDAKENKTLVDDRPTKGNAAEILIRYVANNTIMPGYTTNEVLTEMANDNQKSEQYDMHPQYCECIQCRSYRQLYNTFNGEFE